MRRVGITFRSSPSETIRKPPIDQRQQSSRVAAFSAVIDRCGNFLPLFVGKTLGLSVSEFPVKFPLAPHEVGVYIAFMEFPECFLRTFLTGTVRVVHDTHPVVAIFASE